jgi:hypothetical protein
MTARPADEQLLDAGAGRVDRTARTCGPGTGGQGDRDGDATFRSVEDFVATEIQSTPLAERVSVESYTRIVADARAALAAYVVDDGRISVPLVGHVVVGSV